MTVNMSNNNISLKDVNDYMLYQRKHYVEGHIPHAMDINIIRDHENFMAYMEIMEKYDVPEKFDNLKLTRYDQFEKSMFNGEVVLAKLTSKQSMFYCTFINNEENVERISYILARHREEFTELNKVAAKLLYVIKNETYDSEEEKENFIRLAYYYKYISICIAKYESYLGIFNWCNKKK